MSKKAILAAALAALLGAGGAGCVSFTASADERPIPARAGVAARGGEEIEVEDGNVYARDASIAAALGVTLEEGPDGVRVAAVRRAGTGLERGDRLLRAAASVAGTTGPCGATRTAAFLADRQAGRGIRGVADLERYASAAGFIHLDLAVGRGDAERAVCAFPATERRPVAVVRDRTLAGDGLEVSPLATWPEAYLPLHAGERQGWLVLRVARDSTAAAAGVRPLDVLAPEITKDSFRSSVQLLDPARRYRLTSPDGRRREVAIDVARPATVASVPFLFAFERQARGSRFGLGPFDWLFHWSRRRVYDPGTDAVDERTRWSFLVFEGDRRRTAGGERREAELSLWPGPSGGAGDWAD